MARPKDPRKELDDFEKGIIRSTAIIQYGGIILIFALIFLLIIILHQ